MTTIAVTPNAPARAAGTWNRCTNHVATSRVQATIAASGRYIRWSAATSVTIGTMLDVGVRIRKTHTPANDHGARRIRPHTVAARSDTTIVAGTSTSASDLAIGQL